MGDIKSVKVDNWGVFFLQKLQNFFNKTDYCDLTLQFNDNSQLKVHRLVLSACTDFFNVLEQNCDMIDDALIMPNELQADVVVPIVNFMYTGTLEFELKMYGKLLKTARDMNMTVLLKLLEAHSRTMESASKGPSPKQSNSRGGQWPATKPSALMPSQRRVASNTINTNLRKLNSPKQPTNHYAKQSAYTPVKTKTLKGPARYDADESFNETFETSFDNISYESRPLKEEPDEYDVTATRLTRSGKTVSSTFEQLRQGYTNINNKRPSQVSLESPPEKKPNIEDVKEYAEQQRMRKQIAAEYGDDQEYESILDDEFHNDDDDEEQPEHSLKCSSSPSITIKHEPNQKPTIVVKDNSSIKMNHTKIISEVLKKYPHLIKDSKNIKLKILPNNNDGNTQRVMVKNSDSNIRQQTKPIMVRKPPAAQQSVLKPLPIGPTKSVSSNTKLPVAGSSTTSTVPSQPRRIDSKTMHALIAQGAENTTGPWLCLKCGVNGRPISIPSYRGFRRHLINSHKEKIDIRLCEHCGWRSRNQRELHFHLVTVHELSSTIYSFPKCDNCDEVYFDVETLENHILESHGNQQCIYCNKVFPQEMELYNHMKANHKEKAHEDGVIDFSDDDEMNALMQEVTKTPPKIKILSDISLSSTKSVEPQQVDETEMNTEMSLIDTEPEHIQLHDAEYEAGCSQITQEPKFINADGNEMVLTEEQRIEIMAQLERQDGGVFMVLNETVIQEKETTEETENSAPSNAPGDIIESYNEEDEQTANKSQSEADENGENSISEEMEWAEAETSSQDNDSQDDKNLEDMSGEKIYEGEEYDEKYESDESDDQEMTSNKFNSNEDGKKDEIGLKLKQLAGEWSDDDDDELKDNDVEEIKMQKPEKTEEAVKRLEAELSQAVVEDNSQITESYEESEIENTDNAIEAEEQEVEVEENDNIDANIIDKLESERVKPDTEFSEMIKIEFELKDGVIGQVSDTVVSTEKSDEVAFKEGKEDDKANDTEKLNEKSPTELQEDNFNENVSTKDEANESMECLENEEEKQDSSLDDNSKFKEKDEIKVEENEEEEKEDNLETHETLSPKPTTSMDIQIESEDGMKDATDLEKSDEAITDVVLGALSTELKVKNQITSLICEWEDGDDDEEL